MRISDYIPTSKPPIINVLCFNCGIWRQYIINCNCGCEDFRAIYIDEEAIKK